VKWQFQITVDQISFKTNEVLR